MLCFVDARWPSSRRRSVRVLRSQNHLWRMSMENDVHGNEASVVARGRLRRRLPLLTSRRRRGVRCIDLAKHLARSERAYVARRVFPSCVHKVRPARTGCRRHRRRLLMETPLFPGENFCRVFPGEEVRRVRVRVRKLESSITAVIRRFESRRAAPIASASALPVHSATTRQTSGNNEAKSREHVVTGVMEPSQVPSDRYSSKKSSSPDETVRRRCGGAA